MSQWTVQYPDANVVAEGSKSTFRIPVGSKIHYLYLKYGNLELTEMQNIVLRLNATEVQRFADASVLDTLNQYRGIAAAAATNGTLTLPLDRPFLNTFDARRFTALNTGVPHPDTGRVINSVQLDVDIGTTASASAPTLELYGKVSAATPDGPGAIVRLLPETANPSTTSGFQIQMDSPGAPEQQFLNAAYFLTNQVTKMEVMRNRNTLHERAEALNDVIQADGIRVPQAALYAVDPTEEGDGGNMLNLMQVGEGDSAEPVRDFRYKMDLSGTTAFDYYQEFIGRAP